MTVQEILAALPTIKDAGELTRIATAAQRYARSRARQGIRIGQRAKFTTGSGITIEGTVERINTKTATLVDCTGNSYPYGVRVPFSLLESVGQ